MKKTFIIFSLFALIIGGCKQNKPTTAENMETDLFVQTEDIIAASPVVIDSTLIRINEIIAEEFSAKNLKYEITEKGDTTTKNYSYTFNGDNYTLFRLTIETFYSVQSAQQQIEEWQKMREEEPIKLSFSYFRINNKLYSFFSTANIYHIESKIRKRIIMEKQIKEKDTGAL